MSKFPISECPRCGETWFEVRQYIHGYGTYYMDLRDGNIECDALHNDLTYKNARKYAICSKCGKKLFKIDDSLNVMN